VIGASKQIRNGVKTKPHNLHRILETFVFYVGSEMNCVSSQGKKKKKRENVEYLSGAIQEEKFRS